MLQYAEHEAQRQAERQAGEAAAAAKARKASQQHHQYPQGPAGVQKEKGQPKKQLKLGYRCSRDHSACGKDTYGELHLAH